ncbi:MAG: hypothetical protein COU07_00890 [Candidatus Harrisonbacteria bacterium CG10_big_fil_rev_8_21_14_0_10_40_38]|uniref:Type 4 fimbrial biogenesis protein PilX N-terminal domain-containing protein n=1 Tax=Candidatus Harrisonbacteria bacterium CG10_big_fil_rev_8_21_14_0_10_40_38 TaxID=1974583 RepID=A0A2H0USQ7_9BACT|nr:MAG: hypothetical protein COU07_00890 [Candidatus Harrisonbacteria bacterium CG10_big_fil_rev_8_21_14_0_10_40_38]
MNIKLKTKNLKLKTAFNGGQGGQILIQALVLSALAVVFIAVLINLALYSINSTFRAYNSEQAFQVAEAGIEYYRWHLAHDPTDYTNGTGQPGPYTLPYYDKDGEQIGEIELSVEPLSGTTIVTLTSTGRLYSDASVSRTIQAKLGISSFAKFAVAANDTMRFGEGTEVFGPIHSNGGIRFDGIAHNIITSAVASYNDPDHSGQYDFGVHTHVDPADPLPPSPVPNRPDVFMAGRDFPVPAIDFTGIAADLAQIKTDAQTNGAYYPDSGTHGYEIVFHPDDTYTISKATDLKRKPNGCSDQISDNDWGIWSINATTSVGTYPMPNNGLIFVEDFLWVSGQIDGQRITVASAKFPENPGTQTSINVNHDLLYTNYDGTDVIGLIAQNDINVGLYSEDDLRIDGAIIAKNGRVGRYYYKAPSGNQNYCGEEAYRDTITLYGMIGTNERYGFSWSCGGIYCSGYANRNLIYDANLLFGPPPGFPLTSDEYETISWEEIH